MRRALKAFGLGLLLLVVACLGLLGPVIYVELFCHAPVQAVAYKPLIKEADRRRQRANTYLTYPEWHIVYAYDGLAETLKTGDEHQFGYWQAVRDFWRANCALTRIADTSGGADLDTRMTIATIGVSFTAEMGLKAAYEHTIGRFSAWWRGPNKTPQDIIARDMAIDYAAFLRQDPWYQYAFEKPLHALRVSEVSDPLRGYERKLALGGEWVAKSVYAKAIANAVQASGTEAKLTIFTLVAGLSAEMLSAIKDVTVIGPGDGGILIETPRYDRFTHILADIAKAGGTIREIAGNDEIMLTMTMPKGQNDFSVLKGDVIIQLERSGFAGDRALVSVKVIDLADVMRRWPVADPGIEHVFDY